MNGQKEASADTKSLDDAGGRLSHRPEVSRPTPPRSTRHDRCPDPHHRSPSPFAKISPPRPRRPEGPVVAQPFRSAVDCFPPDTGC